MKVKRTWLIENRRNASKTQQDVAKECGISRQLYSFIENGDRGATVPTAKKIAAVLGFEWQRFYEEPGESTGA